MAGVKHKGPDALLCRPGMDEELRHMMEGGEKTVWRFEEFIDRDLDFMWVSAEAEKTCMGFCNSFRHSFSMLFPMFQGGQREHGNAVGFCFSLKKVIYKGEEYLQRLGEYLQTMPRPVGKSVGELKRFKGFVVLFLVRDGMLYQCMKTGMPLTWVLGIMKENMEVLRQLHDELGHRESEGMYEKA